MISSPLNTKSHFHARSNSLPSRPHPLIPQIDEHLCRLRSTDATSSSSSSSISNKLSALRDLYDLVNRWLLLPHTQQSLAQECNEKQVGEALDASLKLLDVCGIAKDAFFQTKECAQQLQSILRRRRGDKYELANEVGNYLTSRKKAKKLISKHMIDFKSKCTFSSIDHSTINMLKHVEGVTLEIFESTLSYISGTKMQSKGRNWSLVSKLMHSKHNACEDEAETNEFQKVDAVLCTLLGHKSRKSVDMSTENAQNALEKLGSNIQHLEEELECLLRLLIKTRVSLLNILNH